MPVPGRDIFVQAWYQGGVSLVDFTDSGTRVEIGYFDRGPVSATRLVLGGFWSTYWYNGETYGSELARGFDVTGLTPTAQISANEIAAAREVQWDRLNVQHQQRITWEPSFAVARSDRDQLEREGNINARTLAGRQVRRPRRGAERPRQHERRERSAPRARAAAQGDANFAELRGALNDLSDALLVPAASEGRPPGRPSRCISSIKKKN